MRGRVRADRGIPRSAPGDSPYRNLRNTLARLASTEVPNARLEARFHGSRTEVLADAEGHFQTHLIIDTPPPEDRLWHPVELELLEPAGALAATATGSVMIPAPHADFGVVSDIDDTVIRSDVASLVRMTTRVLFGNAHTRVPFPGVGAFFRALAACLDGPPRPVFYVSSSPWNLYDVLEHVIELHALPLGPVELRDWGPLHQEIRHSRHREQKLESIRRIFRTYPSLPFLLIGDSEQEDPEIYRDLVREHPSRVLAVYIRNLRRDPLRERAIRDLADEIESAGSGLVLAEDTLEAARHAERHGWITPRALDTVAVDVRAEGAARRPEARAVLEG